MSNEDLILNRLGDIQGTLGYLKGKAESQEKHITHVSLKVDKVQAELASQVVKVRDGLASHEKDTEAHGQKISNKWMRNAIAIAGVLVAIAALFS